MVRARLKSLVVAAGVGLACGCCDFSPFHRRCAVCEGECAACVAGGSCCEGPSLEGSYPAPAPLTVPAIPAPPVPQYTTVPPQQPAPNRLIPQPQAAQPQPYVPQPYVPR